MECPPGRTGSSRSTLFLSRSSLRPSLQRTTAENRFILCGMRTHVLPRTPAVGSIPLGSLACRDNRRDPSDRWWNTHPFFSKLVGPRREQWMSIPTQKKTVGRREHPKIVVGRLRKTSVRSASRCWIFHGSTNRRRLVITSCVVERERKETDNRDEAPVEWNPA